MDKKISNNILERAEMKKIPFSTPEGYFDSVESRLQEKVFGEKTKGGWLYSMKKTLRPVLTLAASFIIVAVMGWGVMRLTNLSQNQNTIALNTQDEIVISDDLILDSLINRYGAIEVVQLYQNSQLGVYEAETEVSEEESAALEEYITLMAPSFPGLLAEELTQNK